MINDMARTLSAKEIASKHAVSPATIRALAASGQIPADKIGKQYRFDALEVASVIKFSRNDLRK